MDLYRANPHMGAELRDELVDMPLPDPVLCLSVMHHALGVQVRHPGGGLWRATTVFEQGV